MKITIDTQHDTMDDIQKIVHILTNILERKGMNSPSAPVDTAPLMGMFGDESGSTPTAAPQPSAVSSRERISLEEPRIEVY